MPIYSSSGVKLYVSASAPATFDAAGYAVLTWTEVASWTGLGDIGDTYSDVTANLMGSTNRTLHAKDMVDGARPTLDCPRDVSDAGQNIVIAGYSSLCPISLKILHNDLPCSGGTSGTVEYFQALVFSNIGTGLTSGSVDAKNYELQQNSAIVTVPAY